MKKIFIFLILVLTFPFFCSAAEIIHGAGASFPYPVYQAWAFLYNKETKNKINYQSIGSGGGIRQITSKTVDFGASDAPMLPEDLVKNNLLQFPAVMGGVVPIINVEGIEKGTLKLTPEILVDIFLGDIAMWNDPAIVKNNKGIKLPDELISVVHRSDGSGTTAIFSTYLSDVSDKWEKKVGSGKALKWPLGIGGKGNEGVASYVKRIKNSIGYVESAYVRQNNMDYALIQNKDGMYVKPTSEAVKAAAADAKWEQSKGYYLWLVNAPGQQSWPIVGPTFILLSKDQIEQNKKVVQFFDWAFNNGNSAAEKLDYIPLPENLKSDIRNYWDKNGIFSN